MGSRAKITYSYIKEYINSKETGNDCALLTTQKDFETIKDTESKINTKVKLKLSCKCGGTFYTDFLPF